MHAREKALRQCPHMRTDCMPGATSGRACDSDSFGTLAGTAQGQPCCKSTKGAGTLQHVLRMLQGVWDSNGLQPHGSKNKQPDWYYLPKISMLRIIEHCRPRQRTSSRAKPSRRRKGHRRHLLTCTECAVASRLFHAESAPPCMPLLSL